MFVAGDARTARATGPARVGARLGVAFAVCVGLLWACADFSSPEDPAFGLPDVEVANPSFSRDVQPILSKRCAVGGCHTFASAQVGLVLEPSASYDALVNKPAVTSSVGRLLLVRPGSAAQSWLVRRIEADSLARENLPRMPLATTPLTDRQIATIVNWINSGALKN